MAQAFTLRQGRGRLGADRRRQVAHRLPRRRDHAGAAADQGAARRRIAAELRNAARRTRRSIDYVAALQKRLGVAHQRGRVQAASPARRRDAIAPPRSRVGQRHRLEHAIEPEPRRRGRAPWRRMPPLDAFADALRRGRAAGRLDAPRRRPRDAGLGLPQARRRQADELPARIGRRRRRARALLDHRPRARPRLARQRRQGRDQPHARRRSPTPSSPSAQPTLASLRALLAEVAHRAAGRAAADGRRRLRLHGLRHRPPDRAAAERAARRARRARQRADAADARWSSSTP